MQLELGTWTGAVRFINPDFVYACMPRTITISDDVYEELRRLKEGRSFSDVIRSLLRKRSNVDVLMIAFGTRTEDEIRELEDELGEVDGWMRSLTPA